MDYKSTLNLPKTDFSMQAGLPKREPEMLAHWEENKTYEKLMIIARRNQEKADAERRARLEAKREQEGNT